jgi:hypothetical protein
MGITSSDGFMKPRRTLQRETAANSNTKCYGLRGEKSTRSANLEESSLKARNQFFHANARIAQDILQSSFGQFLVQRYRNREACRIVFVAKTDITFLLPYDCVAKFPERSDKFLTRENW